MRARRTLGIASMVLLLVCCTRAGFDVGQRPSSRDGATVEVAKRGELGALETPYSMRWVRKFGGAGDDEGRGLATDAAGNVYVIGTAVSPGAFITTPLPGAASEDAVLGSLTADGTLRWATGLGGTGAEAGVAVTTLDDELFPVVRFGSSSMNVNGKAISNAGKSDLLVLKVTQSAGSFLSATAMGGAGEDRPAAIVGITTTGLYVGGSFEGSMTAGTTQLTSPGPSSGLVLGLNKDSGGPFSSFTLGAPGVAARVTALAADPERGVYVAGQFTGSLAICGRPLVASAGSDAFLALFTSAATCGWVVQLGGPGEDEIAGLALTPGGGVAAVGSFSTSIAVGTVSLTGAAGADIFVASVDELGRVRWARAFGGAGEDHGTALTVGTAGNVFFTGHFTSSALFGYVRLDSRGGSDIFLASLDASGSFRWAGATGSTANDRALGLAISPPEGVFMTGSFCGPIDIGGAPFAPTGLCDGFIARLAP